MIERPDIVVVSCIESGSLEAKTVRLFGALRRWGGELGSARLLAIKARRGSSLRSSTLSALADVGAEFVDIERTGTSRGTAWYQFTNKMVALTHAEQLAGVEQVVFLDADVLPLAPPLGLPLSDGVAFTAAAPDEGIIGSHGPDHPVDGRWATACHLAGIDLAALPMIHHGADDARPIRFYINTGVFAYLAVHQLGRQWGELVTLMLRERLSFGRSGEQWLEQASLGLIVIRAGLHWRLLEPCDNFCVFGHEPQSYRPDRVATARLLHYHDLLNTPGTSPLLRVLREVGRPEVADWLAPQVPTPTAGVSSRLRKGVRALQRHRYRRASSERERRYSVANGALSRTDAPTTLVTCVEAGPLEAMAVRLAQSLRRHGGALRDLPMVMVRPRVGAPLKSETRAALAEENVTLIDAPRLHQFDWNDAYNKLIALEIVERYAATPAVTWVEADVLICREPRELLLEGAEDLRVCASDDGSIGSSGVVIYRTALRLGRRWRTAMHALLAKHVAIQEWSGGSLEQAVRDGLRVGMLPMSAHVCFNPECPAEQGGAALLHYHHWQHRAQWTRFLEVLSEQRPDMASWLAPLGPVDVPARFSAIGKLLNAKRRLQRMHYQRPFLRTPTKPLPPTAIQPSTA